MNNYEFKLDRGVLVYRMLKGSAQVCSVQVMGSTVTGYFSDCKLPESEIAIIRQWAEKNKLGVAAPFVWLARSTPLAMAEIY